MLLADVLQKLINICLEYYGLDPCHYFSSHRLSWDAMLKMTRIELELISENDIYLFVENGQREGISCIVQRFSKANNKYIKFYDNSNLSKYIMYLNANNLYFSAMS